VLPFDTPLTRLRTCDFFRAAAATIHSRRHQALHSLVGLLRNHAFTSRIFTSRVFTPRIVTANHGQPHVYTVRGTPRHTTKHHQKHHRLHSPSLTRHNTNSNSSHHTTQHRRLGSRRKSQNGCKTRRDGQQHLITRASLKIPKHTQSRPLGFYLLRLRSQYLHPLRWNRSPRPPNHNSKAWNQRVRAGR
jgi:hypothetical protein